MGNGCLAPHILNLSTRWGERSASLPGHFTVRQELPLPIEWEPGWSTDLVWNFWRCAKFLIPARIQTPHCLARSLVCMTTLFLLHG